MERASLQVFVGSRSATGVNRGAHPARGRHLVGADKGLVAGRLWAKLWSRGQATVFHAVLDRIDAGLEHGILEGHLPDGSVRLLGGRGEGPHAVCELTSWMALVRVANSGSVGWYVAWGRGEWRSPDPVQIFDLFMRNARTLGQSARAQGAFRLAKRMLHALRGNSRVGAKRNIAAHYDLGNDFYAAWLDGTMSYSSAMFEGGASLESGQRRKIAAIRERVALESGQTLLEIGCGWGALARNFADSGVDVTAITLSDEQKAWAEEHHGADDLPLRFQLTDYRDITGQFDGIASVEMVEAVGQRYWPAYLDCIARCLKPGGRAAIQYIAIDDAIFADYAASADFIQTYIFPGGMLVSTERFRALAAKRGLEWRDERRFGADYARTLKLWRYRFDAAVKKGRLPQGFDRKFIDLWRYYLMYCEGGFNGGGIWVAQVTLVKG